MQWQIVDARLRRHDGHVEQSVWREKHQRCQPGLSSRGSTSTLAMLLPLRCRCQVALPLKARRNVTAFPVHWAEGEPTVRPMTSGRNA